MPDEYMNLTDSEAAELGYRVHRPRRRGPVNGPPEEAAGWGPPEEIMFGLLFFLMACLFAAGLWSATHPSDSGPVLPGATTALALSSRTAPEPASPALSAEDQMRPVPQANPTPARQYVPDGWNSGTAAGPIDLFHGDRVVAVIPAGTEFLCSWGTVHGWSYVVTLDGESSGWARLRPRVVPRRTLLQPKFERALIRLRQFQSSPNYQVLVVYHIEAPGNDQNGAARETINRSAAVESTTHVCNQASVDRELSELIQGIANFDNEGRDHAAVQPQH